MPLCQTFPSTFNILQNTPLSSYALLSDLWISWVIDGTWLLKEYPSLKPNRFLAINLFSIKNWNILSKISSFKIFPQNGSSDIGGQFPKALFFTFFRNRDNDSFFLNFNLISKGFQMCSSEYLIQYNILFLDFPL